MNPENNQNETNVGYSYTNNEGAGREKRKGGFISGLLTGLLVMTVLFGVVFMLLRMHGFGNSTVEVFSGTSSSEELLDDATKRKIELVASTIDQVYYKAEDIDVEAQRVGLLNGLVDSLSDPYSTYYTGEEFKDLVEQTEGIYFGIGAYISRNEDRNLPYISGVIKNSPAEEAGLRENDFIMEVDGTSTYGMQTDEVASIVRGEAGTTVHLLIRREGTSDDLEFDVTRRQILTPTVEHEMLDDGIGYLQITEFDDVTLNQFLEAKADLEAQGMRALLLDLRSNPGGNLDTVCDIARHLLPKGVIVYTLDRNENRTDYSSDGKNEIQIPVAVLVNGNSASASEILAGALQDYQKATIIGTTTFGKGVVQRIVTFNDGTAVKLTVSNYYTPNGNDINGTGITPDIEVVFDADAYEEDKSDNQKDRAAKELLDMLD